MHPSCLVRTAFQFSWSEVFGVIDQLSREGTLVLRRTAKYDYEVGARPIPEPSLGRLNTVGEGVLR